MIRDISPTTRPLDLGVDSVVPTTAEEQLAQSILDNQAEVQKSARASQRAAQQLQQIETTARVKSLHEAADNKLIGGLISAGSSLASTAGGAMGGGWETAGKSAAAAGNGVAAWFNAQADHATADAAAHEQLAARAGDAGRESGEAARAAEQTADRHLQQLGQVLEAKRRAADAANRG